MNNMDGLLLSLMAGIASAGCGGVSERPGNDFSVRVLDGSAITVVGQIYTQVPFAVDGCKEFDVAFQDGAGALHSLPYASQPDGTFQASIPVSWIRYYASGPWAADGGCAVEARYPPSSIEGALIATCRDVGRSARAELSVTVATAPTVHSLGGPVRAIFPSDDPLLPWTAIAYKADGWLRLDPRFPPSLDRTLVVNWEAAAVNSLVRPRLARNGDRVFVTLGCEPHAACPQANERLADVSLTDARDARPRGFAHVPTTVIDIAYGPDGSLVVLSQTGDLGYPIAWGRTSTIVSRVDPAPEGSQGSVEEAVTVIAELPGHAPMGKLVRKATGELLFLTRAYPDGEGPINAVLHSTDGHTADEVMVAAVAAIRRNDTELNPVDVFLSPDGSSVLVDSRSEGMYLLSTDPANPARDRFAASWDWYADGAVWTPGAIVLWYVSGGSIFGEVQVYDRAAPHALRWKYEVEPLPGAVTPPYLLDVTGVGDDLVLTTSTGLRILAPDGTLVGGSDPFPCGAAATAMAEQTGPSTVAVGVGDLLYVFDVGGASASQ
jgi:hypothetical protein